MEECWDLTGEENGKGEKIRKVGNVKGQQGECAACVEFTCVGRLGCLLKPCDLIISVC